MSSDVQICNMALGAIAARTTINSLDESSVAAQQCNIYYTTIRDALLSQARWNFARKQINLALLKDGTIGNVVLPPWTYEYSYPTDCIQARYIMPMFENSPLPFGSIPAMPTPLGPPVKFIISTDEDTNGQPLVVILTNQQQAHLVYTYRATNPANFSSQFVDAFVGALAARLCVPLNGNLKLTQLAIGVGQAALKAAQASDGNEGITVQDIAPDWMRVRGYLSDWATPDWFILSQNSSQLFTIS